MTFENIASVKQHKFSDRCETKRDQSLDRGGETTQ